MRQVAIFIKRDHIVTNAKDTLIKPMNQAMNAQQVLATVINDKQSGASEIAQTCLRLLPSFAIHRVQKQSKDVKGDVLRLIEKIKSVRPSMAPLQYEMSHLATQIRGIESSDAAVLTQRLSVICQQSQDDAKRRIDKQIHSAKSIFSSMKTLMTYSRSSLVARALSSLPQRPLEVIVCESRPGFEGRVLAQELAQFEIDVRFIVDAASSLYIARVDAIVVGADTVLSDGSIVNKCGTALIALMAMHYAIPFYVMADISKYTHLDKKSAVLEHMPVGELDAPTSPFIHPENYYFDITDAAFISGYVSEFGVTKSLPW